MIEVESFGTQAQLGSLLAFDYYENRDSLLMITYDTYSRFERYLYQSTERKIGCLNFYYQGES